QIPLSCVSVALWAEGAPKLGVVCDITRAELFAGIASETAFLNDQPIAVSDVVHAHDAILCTGFPAEADFSSTRLAAFFHDIQRCAPSCWRGTRMYASTSRARCSPETS